jgi:hypothetical protein
LYNIIQDFIEDRNLNRLLARFEKVKHTCADYDKILESIGFWSGSAYFLVGDYDKAWDCLKTSYIRIADVINIRSRCNDTSIDGNVLIRLTRESRSLLTE